MGLLVSGKNPAALKTAQRLSFVATAGQTVFTIPNGYSVGDIDVYMNGIRLVDSDDFFAIDGSTITLVSPALVGDHIHVMFFNQFAVGGSYSKSETDARYMSVSGLSAMTGYLKTPNYGISSTSDTQSASLEASSLGSGIQGVGIKAWGRSMPSSGGELTYITDTRGASGQHIFYGWNGSSLTQQMKIDNAGRINIINQPSILLNGNGGSTAFSGGQYVTQMTAEHSVGGMVWDSGLGRVTVPVTGKYLISTNVYHYSIGGRRHSIMHNGTQVGLSQSSNSTTADESRSITMVRNLGAGDWIGLQIVYAGTYYMGYAHTHLSVHLLG